MRRYCVSSLSFTVLIPQEQGQGLSCCSFRSVSALFPHTAQSQPSRGTLSASLSTPSLSALPSWTQAKVGLVALEPQLWAALRWVLHQLEQYLPSGSWQRVMNVESHHHNLQILYRKGLPFLECSTKKTKQQEEWKTHTTMSTVDQNAKLILPWKQTEENKEKEQRPHRQESFLSLR